MPQLSADIRQALLTGVLALAIAACLLLLMWQFRPAQPVTAAAEPVQPPASRQVIEVSTAREMARALDAAGISWPPAAGQLPGVVVAGLPDDMDSLTASERQALFLRMVLVPTVIANRNISQERRYLDAITRHGLPVSGSQARITLEALAQRYMIAGGLEAPDALEQLRQRVDEIPVALVLAAAVVESGWGLSRFAVSSNALFGQWSGRVGQVPRSFERPDESVHHFMHTLNTHPAFTEFRQARSDAAPLSVMSETLTPWSPAHEGYTRELQLIIEAYELDQLPPMPPSDSAHD